MSVFQTSSPNTGGADFPVPPVGQEPSTIDQTTADTGEAGGTAQSQPPQKPVEIVLRGPLSHVYTQVLNVLYAKDQPEDAVATENMMSTIQLQQRLKEKKEAGDIKERGVFVYVTDASRVEQRDVVDMYDEIQEFQEENPDRPVIAVMESGQGFTKAASTFSTHLSQMGVKTYYSRDAASNALGRLLKA